jgi:hypothetical protein
MSKVKVKFKKDKGDLKKDWVLEVPAFLAERMIEEGSVVKATAKDSVTSKETVNKHLSELKRKRSNK